MENNIVYKNPYPSNSNNGRCYKSGFLAGLKAKEVGLINLPTKCNKCGDEGWIYLLNGHVKKCKCIK